MEVLTSLLPSGGINYKFPSVSISPMKFVEVISYMENVPSDPLEKYLFDIRMLTKEDPKILDCYVMDVDFLIFYKKLITVSGDKTYTVNVTCPHCGKTIKKKINIDTDVHFKQIDSQLMNGAIIELNGHKYDTIIPTVRDFLKVFEVYLRVKKTRDLNLIKTIALISSFDLEGNKIENDVMNATHEDITLLMALRDIYYDRVEPLKMTCSDCKDTKEGGDITVSVNSLIVDFFRELYSNSPINGSKILFK